MRQLAAHNLQTVGPSTVALAAPHLKAPAQVFSSVSLYWSRISSSKSKSWLTGKPYPWADTDTQSSGLKDRGTHSLLSEDTQPSGKPVGLCGVELHSAHRHKLTPRCS